MLRAGYFLLRSFVDDIEFSVDGMKVHAGGSLSKIVTAFSGSTLNGANSFAAGALSGAFSWPGRLKTAMGANSEIRDQSFQ